MSSPQTPTRKPSATQRRGSNRPSRRSSHDHAQSRNHTGPSNRDSTRPRRSSRVDVSPDSLGEYRVRRPTISQRPAEDLYRNPRRRSSGRRTSYEVETPVNLSPDKSRGFSPSVAIHPISPYTDMSSPGHGTDHELISPSPRRNSVGRRKTLVRPERRQANPEDADYYYRKHAQRMNVMPSTTGRDPQLEDDSDGANFATAPNRSKKVSRSGTVKSRTASTGSPTSSVRKQSHIVSGREVRAARQAKRQEAMGPPTLWGTYCHLVTCWCPNAALKLFGFKESERRRAWREKIGLLSIMALVMGFVGFLTFGFTEIVCNKGGGVRLRVNHVDTAYMIFHGEAYDLSRSHHPYARGIPKDANVLYNLAEPHGGQDGSFLFQNVNGACKGLVTLTNGSDVPTNSNGDVAWYFPCRPYNQDGSSKPSYDPQYYLGYACHTQYEARQQFYSLKSSGDVYFTWEDVKNASRNLVVYSGNVLDLDLLSWFNHTQINVPERFTQLQNDSTVNAAIRGKDISLAFSTVENREIAQCLSEIIKVGSVDTDTVGCFASSVVLYISLIFILGIVVIRFTAAILFQWLLCRKYGAPKTSMSGDSKRRKQEIEDWADDIYRPPPKITEPVERERQPKRSSILPTTSRFSSPYAIERALNKNRPPPMTMATQYSSLRGFPSRSDRSEATMQDGTIRPGTSDDGRTSVFDPHTSARYSSVMNSEGATAGPEGLIHESVVPQPPAEWQPFGFPLAHTICLVTAYSEGPEGIRTTLDSIAMTDYPNSHKIMFVVCDGLVHGKGEKMSTPDACLSMLKDHAVPPSEVQAFSYVAVASGSKRHNMAKIYAGFYDYGYDSIIPVGRQQRVPMIVLVKCGTPDEKGSQKPGNRGKRDSQIILMSFLQKVMFDERMTELEYEMFNGIWKITGISPDFYEIVLMVDADTKVFPDSLTHMVFTMVNDPEIMGLCGETKIANKSQSWVTMIQVFEYFISHHQLKSFESCFGGVTCLPGCFCMYRIKAPKGGQNYWVPILANPDIVEHYSENVVDTLHKKNLYLLGEDRYLSTLMLKTFPKRKQVFVPQAVCKTTVPDTFKVLLSQRRRWINSTIHNLMELVLVRDLCGTFCFSMQFVVFIDLVGTVVLPAAICFTIYVITLGIISAITHTPAPTIPLVLLALILGLPAILIVITAHRPIYVIWMLIYLLSLPIWNLVLPTYAYWHFDDFSWGDTRKTVGEVKGAGKGGHDGDGEFDSSRITMKRWADFEAERRARGPGSASIVPLGSTKRGEDMSGMSYPRPTHERRASKAGFYESYRDSP